MTVQRITKRIVDSLAARESEFTVWDADLTGFGVRVRPNGSMSYVVVYRAGHGRKAPVRKVTLGGVGKLTPDDARVLARKIVGAVAHGQDPAAEKAEKLRGMTVRELADSFLAEHIRIRRKKPTVAGYEHALQAHVIPNFGSVKADSLSRASVAKLHMQMKETPAAANYTLAVIGSMYGFAQRRGYVPEGYNPASRIEKYPEVSRERFLSVDELSRLGNALREAETVGIPWAADASKPTSKHLPREANRRTVFGPLAVGALRLLLFTGCRLREILDLRWEYVDFDRGLLFLPDSKTGKKAIVLNAPALKVLSSLPRLGPYVVPGDSPERPRHDLKKIWAAVSRRADLGGVRIHDLRHTFASVGAGSGLGLPIVGKLLGHSQPSTTQRYAHLDADPVRRASNVIGHMIASAIGDDPMTENVLPLKNFSKAG